MLVSFVMVEVLLPDNQVGGGRMDILCKELPAIYDPIVVVCGATGSMISVLTEFESQMGMLHIQLDKIVTSFKGNTWEYKWVSIIGG